MQAAPSRTQGNYTAGIVVMCVGVACLSANDAMAKALTAHYTPLQILFLRNVIALPFTVLIALIMGGRPALKTHRPLTHLLRGVLWVAATMLFFTSFIYLGLAEATALIFVAPVFITVISALFLGERVHIRRWLAVFFGFLGVLIIIRPGGATFQAASQQVHADRHYFSGKHIRSVASVLIQCGKAPQLRLSLI